MKKYLVGIELWDSDCRYEDDILDSETIAIFDNLEDAQNLYEKIKKENNNYDNRTS